MVIETAPVTSVAGAVHAFAGRANVPSVIVVQAGPFMAELVRRLRLQLLQGQLSLA